MQGSIMVGITEIQSEIDTEQSLEDRLKFAMRKALGHWLVLEEEAQFKMAISF